MASSSFGNLSPPKLLAHFRQQTAILKRHVHDLLFPRLPSKNCSASLFRAISSSSLRSFFGDADILLAHRGATPTAQPHVGFIGIGARISGIGGDLADDRPEHLVLHGLEEGQVFRAIKVENNFKTRPPRAAESPISPTMPDHYPADAFLRPRRDIRHLDVSASGS